MKKITLFIIILIATFNLPAITVYADEQSQAPIEDTIEGVIDQLDLTFLQELLDQYVGNDRVKDVILQALKGEYLSFEQLIELIVDSLKKSATPFISTSISIFLLLVLCGILTSIKSQKDNLSEIIFIACYCIVCAIVFSEVKGLINMVASLVTSLIKQIDAFFPILLTLISFTGANATAGVYGPLNAVLTKSITVLSENVLMPIISLSTVLAITGSLNHKLSTKKLQDFFNSAFKWIIGLIVVNFSLFSTVKGLTAGAYDNLSLRALKYAVSNSLPLLGGFTKEGIDVIITSSVLIKNAIGGIAIVLLFLACLSPFIKIVVFSLFLKFLSGIIEPFADTRITQLLSSFAKIVTMLATLLLMIFIVYCINFLLLIGAQSSLIG